MVLSAIVSDGGLVSFNNIEKKLVNKLPMKDEQKRILHRRLAKLKRDPKGFFLNSRLNILGGRNKVDPDDFKQKSSVLPSLGKSGIEKITLNTSIKPKGIIKPIQGSFDFLYFIELLRNYDVNGVYIIPLDMNARPVLAVLESQKEEFLKKFFLCIHDEGLFLRYKSQGVVKSIDSLTQFWQEIKQIKKIDVRISTNRIIGDGVSFFWYRLEFCSEEFDHVMFPSNNIISRRLWSQTIRDYGLFEGIQDYSVILKYPHELTFNFDVDLVFTWVNSDDEDWKEMYHQYKPIEGSDATSTSRFFSRDELKYALRSWEKYGSFIRKIFIVSNCKPPKWFDENNSKITWVYHQEIIPESALPTFSSHAIESCLHKIPNLSKYFIYCNDDILLVKPLTVSTFYYHNGIAKLRMEPYGNINGKVSENDPDYMNAARNSTYLLEEKFKQTPTQIHTHSPQSMRKDVLEEINQEFYEYFERTMHNKFRSIDDISVTSYLYQHYALLSGYALQSDEKTELVIARHNYARKFKTIIENSKAQNYSVLPISVCINDGADSHDDEKWNLAVLQFLEALFPNPSSFEKHAE